MHHASGSDDVEGAVGECLCDIVGIGNFNRSCWRLLTGITPGRAFFDGEKSLAKGQAGKDGRTLSAYIENLLEDHVKSASQTNAEQVRRQAQQR